MRKKTVVIYGVAFMIQVLLAFSAFPQETSKNDFLVDDLESEDQSHETAEVHAIKVTAGKREQKAESLPLSVTVLPAEELDQKGIGSAERVARFVPNTLMTGTPVRNVFVMRGISSFSTSIYSPVAMYIDDVCMPLHLSNNPDLYDIERIEVLKGPQGTLYGRNSEAGVIHIITKQPGNKVRAGVKETFEMYDTDHGYQPSYTTSAQLHLPLQENLLYLGLAGSWRRSDGYIENTYTDDEEAGDLEHFNYRGTLRVTPAERWDISLTADGLKNDSGMAAFRYDTGENKTDRHEVSFNEDAYSEELGYGQAFTMQYDAGAWRVLSITGHRYYENDYQNDLDCTANSSYERGANHFEWTNRIVSEEVRIISDQGKSLEWLCGVYGFQEETDIDFENDVLSKQTETDIDIAGCAAFGEGTVSFYRKWHLTAGLRYEYQELDGEFHNHTASTSYDKELTYNELLPKFSFSWDPLRQLMAYTSVSRGYMSGGYNYVSSTDEDSFSYDPEYTWNYEAGIKSRWFQNRVGLDLCFFYIDIKDKQVFEIDQDTMANTIENAARAHSIGCEVQLFVEPLPDLRLNSGLGYADARFDSWKATENHGTTMSPDIVEVDYEDKRLSYASHYTYNLGMSYAHPSGFIVGGDLHGNSSFYSDAANTMKEDGYYLIDVRVGYQLTWLKITLWCKNICDKSYATYRDAWNNESLVIDGAPRSFGFTMEATL